MGEKKMKVAKIKNQSKNKKEVIEKDSYSLLNLLKIVLVVLLTFIIFYLITFLVLKNNTNKDNSNSITEIDSTLITFNSLLNRNENEYYVLAYKSKNINDKANYKTLYDNYISQYKQKTEALNFYMIDIDDAFNKSYIGDELNISSSLDELKINDEVLFKINNGTIENSFVGSEEILNKLSEL